MISQISNNSNQCLLHYGCWATSNVGCSIYKTSQRRWLTSAGSRDDGIWFTISNRSTIAHPDEQVICISGDASFQMNIQELGTVAQYGLPIKLLL